VLVKPGKPKGRTTDCSARFLEGPIHGHRNEKDTLGGTRGGSYSAASDLLKLESQLKQKGAN